MSIDIALSSNFDIDISKSGDIRLVYDNNEIVQTAISNIKTRYGEMYLDPTRGNKIFNSRVKLNNSSMGIVETECKNAILVDNRIASVESVFANKITDRDFNCYIKFAIKTVSGYLLYGETNITI